MPAISVTCPAGEITGVREESCQRFQSIPYSHIPSPFENATAEKDLGAFDARSYRPGTIALSITTPLDAQPLSDFPVVAYIHGGRYEHGTHGDRRADGTPNARAGVITVHIGYRVKLPGFARFHDDEPTFFRGIDDCQLALEWIQRNIEFFGGDPTNVTVVGQSAGATTALWLMRPDHYRGAFRRTIAQSPCFPRQGFSRRKTSLRMALGAPITRAGLGRLSEKQLNRGYQRFRRLHGLDMALGPTLTDPGDLVEIPLWITSTREEFYSLSSASWGAGAARIFARRFGMRGDFRTWLAAAQEIDPDHVFGRLVGDGSNRQWVCAIAEAAPGPVWMSEFIDSTGPALHCADIPLVFGLRPHPLHEKLVSFAHGNTLDWPLYTPPERLAERMDLATGRAEVLPDPLQMVREAF